MIFFLNFNALNGSLLIHFVFSDEKLSIFKEFEFQISLSPWRVEMLIVDQCISSFGAKYCCSWLGRLLDILSGDVLLFPLRGGGTEPLLASW